MPCRRLASLVILASTLTASCVLAAPPVVDRLASAPEEIRLRIRFEAPSWSERTSEGRQYRFPSWEGVEPIGEGGGPGLPTYLVQVAVPPAGRIDLAAEGLPRGSARGVRFPPVPRIVAPGGIQRGQMRPDPVYAFGEGPGYERAPTAPLAELLHVGVDRGLRVATVAVHPVTWRAATGEASWYREVTVSLRGGEVRKRGTRPRRDLSVRTAWSTTLQNPEDAAAWSVSALDSVPPPGIPEVWFDDGAGWLKIRVKENGIYAVGVQDLLDAGVSPGILDPRTFRLFSGPLVPDLAWTTLGWDSVSVFGQSPVETGWRHVYERPGFSLGFADTGGVGERAILVGGEADGSFDDGDRVLFYALGPDNYRDRFGLPLDTREDWIENPYSDETVYWLTWGGNFQGDPLRMETVDGTPGPGPRVTTSITRLHAERNTIYDPSMHAPPHRWERWFWESMDSPGGHRFRIDLPHLVPGSPLDLLIRLWGAQVPLKDATGEEARHHVRVTVNDADGGLYAWGEGTTTTSFLPFDAALTGMPSADPCVVVCAIPVVGTNPNRFDKVHLTWIDFRYERALDLAGGAGELEIGAGSPDRPLSVANVAGGELLVLDVSDAARPRRLLNTVRNGSNLELGWTDPAGGVVAVAPLVALPAPPGVELDVVPARWLRDPGEPLDYVILTADEFASEAEVLASWRRQHLYPYTPAREARVRVVRVSDVMDEFAWGMWDPVALRYFLEYAYRYYGQPGSDPLAYCLFLGDSTYDPRNFGLSGSRDYLPSWEDNRDPITSIGSGNVQYVSDDPLARFDGRDSNGRLDLYTDLYIGRITARTRLEAGQLIRNKVIRAEEDPDFGPWRSKAILVADDVCQGTAPDGLGFTHILQTEILAGQIPDRFDLDKIYLYEYGEDCLYNSKPAAKQALLDSWSEGAFLVNYVGHGGDAVWADEHVLDLADTPLLTNEGRYPVVGSFSCSVGKFSQPVGEGLAESHLRAPRGGALVSLAATHLTISGNNSAFNKIFFEELVKEDSLGTIPIGVALMRAKRRVPIFSPLKYVCLGDPASLPSFPRERLDLDPLAGLNRGETITVTSRLRGGMARDGLLDLLIRDASLHRDRNSQGEVIAYPYDLPGALLFQGESDVRADTSSTTLTIPFTLRGGDDGRVRAYAWGPGWDAVGALAPLPVGGTTFEVSDTTGPRITFSVEDGADARAGDGLEAVLEDPAGINVTRLFEFQSVLLKIFDAEEVEILRQDLTPRFTYERGSTSKGGVSFNVPDLEPGRFLFQLSATDNYNNRTRANLELVLDGGGGSGGAFTDFTAAYPNPFDPGAGPTQLVYHLSEDAEVSVTIYTVSGRLVLQANQDGRRGANSFTWDGTDGRMDPVANGVYLVRLAARSGGGEEETQLERVVVLR
jgi:hypothetical protein